MSEPLRLRPVLHSRQSAFSYDCRACKRCCHNKRILVNPYEVARMARHLAISTTEFLARYSRGGVALATVGDACVFLSGSGCAVHPHRPLACRLYPLGRVAGAGGQELFVQFEPQVGSEGRYGNDGTVAQYLELQGVEPYLRAADRYYDAVVAVAGAVTAALPADAPAPDDETDRSRPAAAPQPAGDDVASDLPAEFLDLDAAAAAMAAASDIPLPPALEARLELHLAWLYQQASRGGSPAQD